MKQVVNKENKLLINKNTKKCFIFDLDGTIIFNNQFLDKQIEEALIKILGHNHKIVFATGRPLRDFIDVMPKWSLEHPLVLFGGAISMYQEKFKIKKNLDIHICNEIVNICNKNKFYYIIENYFHYYCPVPKDGHNYKLYFINPDYKVKDITDIFKNEIYKITIFDIDAVDYFRDFAKANNLDLRYHFYDRTFDLVAHNTNKFNSIQWFINDFDANDVFIFGNDYNDYELFYNFKNGVLIGNIENLLKITPINLNYDTLLISNIVKTINSILEH